MTNTGKEGGKEREGERKGEGREGRRKRGKRGGSKKRGGEREEGSVTKTPAVWSRYCCLLHRKPITETSIAKEEAFNQVLQLMRWKLSLKSIFLTD